MSCRDEMVQAVYFLMLPETGNRGTTLLVTADLSVGHLLARQSSTQHKYSMSIIPVHKIWIKPQERRVKKKFKHNDF